MFGQLKRLLTPRRSSENGKPISTVWVADRERATLVNPESGRMHGFVWHDGCGKYYPTVVVSPWRAFQLVRRHSASLVSLLSFPLCTVELYRLKADTIGEAQQQVEYGLGYYD